LFEDDVVGLILIFCIPYTMGVKVINFTSLPKEAPSFRVGRNWAVSFRR
jgi:hypothetical protein